MLNNQKAIAQKCSGFFRKQGSGFRQQGNKSEINKICLLKNGEGETESEHSL